MNRNRNAISAGDLCFLYFIGVAIVTSSVWFLIWPAVYVTIAALTQRP